MSDLTTEDRPVIRMAFALGMILALVATPVFAGDTRIDGTEDNGGVGPDITAVTVDVAGEDLLVVVELAAEPALSWSEEEEYTDSIMVIASTDAAAPPDEALQGSRSTMNGFAIGVHAANLDSPAPFTPIVDGQSGEVELGITSVDVAGRTVTLTVPLTAVGDPADLHLFVFAGREGVGAEGGDTYPDETWATFDVAALGAPDASPYSIGLMVVVALAAFVVLAVLVGRSVRPPKAKGWAAPARG